MTDRSRAPAARALALLLSGKPVLVLASLALMLASASWAKVESWRQEGPTGFARAKREGVVISDDGRVRLGRSLTTTGGISCERVWDLARTESGALFAATGDQGKVFRLDSKAGSTWTLALETKDSQVLSLAATPDGKVLAGTGPGGWVFDANDPKRPGVRVGPKVQYVWDLAVDRGGDVYAATGPEGELWRRARATGRWELVFDSRMSHLLCVAIGKDGMIYVGSDREGLIYRVTPAGKATVVFDAPQSEVRTLLWGGDGALYAGTAAEVGGGARSTPFMAAWAGEAPPLHALDDEPREALAGRAQGVRGAIREPAQAKPASPSRSPGGSAAPRPVSPGENAVYHFDAEMVPREILRARAMIHALAWVDDRLLVGAGPEGVLHEIRAGGTDTAQVAKLDNGQILALLTEPGGAVVIGAGDPGAVARLSAGYLATARLTSEVKDAKLVSRFGALAWTGATPSGTAIAVQCRSGNVGEPDETWSAWSAGQTDPANAAASAPPGRFIQYRAILSTTDPRHTPELRSISLAYRTTNLAPEITRLEVPDLSALDGTAKQARLTIRWDAADPNDDELSFTLKVKKQGWPDWIAIGAEPLTERTHAWDTTPFPSGTYELKLTASDRRSNSPEETLTRERESVPFLVDHESPVVAATAKGARAAIVIKDALTRIVSADYSLDGGAWTPIFPDDGLFDKLEEHLTLALRELKPGVHVVMIRATDAAGNTGAGDVLVEPGP